MQGKDKQNIEEQNRREYYKKSALEQFSAHVIVW